MATFSARLATLDDVDVLVTIINRAFDLEEVRQLLDGKYLIFFILKYPQGNRTNANEVISLLKDDKNKFIVLNDNNTNSLVGTVLVELNKEKVCRIQL